MIRTPDMYFESVQYNWTGAYDNDGKKIPGDKPEAVVRGLYHPLDEGAYNKEPFSMVDFKVFAGAQLNPVRFKTIRNVVHITAGTGLMKIFDEKGEQVVSVQEVKPRYTVVIPPKTKYSFASDKETDLTGVITSTPAWSQEDEEYDWDLVKFVTSESRKDFHSK